MSFNLREFGFLVGGTFVLLGLAIVLFNRGLKSYTSSNLVGARS